MHAGSPLTLSLECDTLVEYVSYKLYEHSFMHVPSPYNFALRATRAVCFPWKARMGAPPSSVCHLQRQLL
jgi:hypothetical protein